MGSTVSALTRSAPTAHRDFGIEVEVGHADPAEVDIVAPRGRLDALATDPFVVFSGKLGKES